MKFFFFEFFTFEMFDIFRFSSLLGSCVGSIEGGNFLVYLRISFDPSRDSITLMPVRLAEFIFVANTFEEVQNELDQLILRMLQRKSIAVYLRAMR